MRIEADPKGTLQRIGPVPGDEATWRERLHAAFGTVGDAFALTELDRLITACKLSDGSIDPIRINAVLAAIDGVRPRNELEAMLAAEIAITHGLVIDFLHKAKRAQYLPQLEAQGRLAAKLMRALAGHIELLAKLQRGGEQTVRVEHVHVHAGGQAVVGHVAVGGRG
ncbi:MAG: hypothetical protein U1E49_20755 [Hyphomicrobiaceae bacterium]